MGMFACFEQVTQKNNKIEKEEKFFFQKEQPEQVDGSKAEAEQEEDDEAVVVGKQKLKPLSQEEYETKVQKEIEINFKPKI